MRRVGAQNYRDAVWEKRVSSSVMRLFSNVGFFKNANIALYHKRMSVLRNVLVPLFEGLADHLMIVTQR
jgi:hypothetical protein